MPDCDFRVLRHLQRQKISAPKLSRNAPPSSAAMRPSDHLRGARHRARHIRASGAWSAAFARDLGLFTFNLGMYTLVGTDLGAEVGNVTIS